MEKERLNKNFLHEFKEFDFSRIQESKIYLVGSIKFKDYYIKGLDFWYFFLVYLMI